MEKIGDDLLRGVARIARFINEEERSTYHKLARGYLPGGKEGSEWIASKTVLREHYRQLTAATKKVATNPTAQTKKRAKDQAASHEAA
jgi:hypothetical protein